MSVGLLEPLMTDEKEKAIPVKLRAEVVKAARIVSSYREVAMVDMLSDILAPILERMERDEIAKRGREQRKSK